MAYAAFRGGLVLSHDGGDTWQVFDLAKLGGDGTPQDMAFLSNGRIAFSVYPLLGWQPLVEVRGKSGRPVSYPTPLADTD